jgi:hypothetical protein
MPVEIKELIIRAVVTEAHDQDRDALTPAATPDDTDAIIAACVKQVLKILQQTRDR